MFSLGLYADQSKNTDRAETIKILQRLLEVSATTYQKIRVYLALIPARLDYSQNLTSMPHDSWVSCMHEFDNFMQLLLDEPDYIVQEQTEDYDDMVDREPETKDGKVQRVGVAGGLVGILENLDNEVNPELTEPGTTLRNIVHENFAKYRCP